MSTKQCSKCKQILPVENFRWKNKSKGILHSQCKMCQKAQEKIHYQESKDRRDAVRATAEMQKTNNVIIVEQARQCGCIKCGEKRSYVLDFHHRDPAEKTNVLAHMIKSASESALIAELAKCDVLCANCHREFHFLEKEFGITYSDYLDGKIAYEV